MIDGGLATVVVLAIIVTALAVGIVNGRPEFRSQNLLILTGSCVIALSVLAENLELVGFPQGESAAWLENRYGRIGGWQVAGVIIGAISMRLGVAMRSSRLTSLVERHERLTWVLPRLLAIAAAAIVIAVAVPRIGACPPEGPDGTPLVFDLGDSCVYECGGCEL